MVAINSSLSFEYHNAKIGDLRVESSENKSGQTVVEHVRVNDEDVKPTERFWTSLYARFGFNKSLLQILSPRGSF